MSSYRKAEFDVAKVRRLLEPGPVVLVTSRFRKQRNIMTLGWHTVLEFSPSLVGCMISSANHSFQLIRNSKECVINVPERHLARTVVDIGNCSGRDGDKFEKFGLSDQTAETVSAPVIKECYAHLECKLYDGALIRKYNFFIFEVVRAYAAVKPKHPKTIHYRGNGAFMISGEPLNLKSRFAPDKL
ncbi:MAG: flavin reductase family protein [Bdellovibrionota bacterium]